MTDQGTVYFGHSLGLLLASIFFVAAVTKVRRPSRFVAAVRDYELVPRGLSAPLAGAVVAAELFVAASLFSGWALSAGILIANVLLLVFAIAVGVNLRRGHVVSCGCFGSSTERISWRTLGRIGLLMLAGIGLAVLRLSGTVSPNVSDLVTDAAGLQQLALTAALASLLVMCGAWLLHLPEMAAVLRPTRIEAKGD